MVGRSIRLNRILNPNTGKTLIIAIDHGTAMYPEGIENPVDILKKMVKGKPDAILLNLGVIRFGYNLLQGKEKPGIILRLDWTSTWRKVIPVKNENLRHIFSVEDAVRFGADAVLAYLFYGPGVSAELEATCTENLGKVVKDCERFGMPLIAEAHLSPLASKKDRINPKHLTLVTRTAAELGADLIKTEYTGDIDSFKEVVRNCPIPITVLGGSKMANDKEVLETVKGAIEAGASGVTMGRNIWQHRNPEAIIKAIKKIIHHNISIKEALQLI